MLNQKLTDLITEPIVGLGYELVGVEFIQNRISVLRVYIDNKNGIGINDCINVSHRVGAILDIANPITVTYNLEVSSPGLNRPLFTVEHYKRFIGEEVALILRIAIENQRKWRGIINAVDNRILIITVKGKDKMFALNNIQKANLIPYFLRSGLR